MATASSLPRRLAAVRPSLGADARAIALGACLLAVSAQVAIPCGPLQVPFTLQPQMVLALACALGRQRAVAAVLAYLAAGAAGAPAFAGLSGGLAHLFGLRGGFLLGFVPAAYLVGGAAARRSPLAWALASALILACGWAYLALWVGPAAALSAGVAPFWLSDAGKAAIAWVLCRRLCPPAPAD